MHPDHIAVERQCFDHLPSLVPFAGFAGIRLILKYNRVSDFERRELFGASRETFFHFCMSLSMSLFPEICFKSPLFPGLVFGHHSRQEAFEFPSEDNHGRTELSEWVDCVTMFEQRPGKSVGVKRAFGAEVAHDEALGGLHSKFSSLVSPWIICRRHSVFDSPTCQEVLSLGGGENSSPVARDLLGNPPSREVLSEDLDDMVRIILGKFEDTEPDGVPVCDG